MNLRTIEPNDFNDFQEEIESFKNSVERTLNLTWFYVNARFKIPEREFKTIYSVDGANDGGIDCYFHEGNTFYLIQSKYHENSKRESLQGITHELQKIDKTIVGENTNKNASDYINSLRRALDNPASYLEIIWLSTNEVPDSTRKDAQRFLDEIIGRRNWQLNADINFIDRYALEGVIYDIKHGYVPHTGKKLLHFEPGECMTIDKGRDNIESIVCNIRAVDILKWFNNAREISKFLQKNVRESIGENSINKSIQKSFKNDPSLFWYKHNGIIIFADWLDVNHHTRTVTIRNPQIVNGAQTISQLFKVYDENRNENNLSKLLVRVYRLPYEDSETYKRSIDIITALNSQNKIKASDLRSTDPRQVMIENRINQLSSRFSYYRKRKEDGRRIASPSQILMSKLALYFHVCEYKKPDEGIAGATESYFEEEKKYNESFPEGKIQRPLLGNVNHIIFKYIDCWSLYYFIDRSFRLTLSKKHGDLYGYVFWYLLVDIYNQLQDWKEKQFSGGGGEWIQLIESEEFFNAISKYARPRYLVYYQMLPVSEADPRNFYKNTAGRNKFSANSGDPTLFLFELGKGYVSFRKRNGY